MKLQRYEIIGKKDLKKIEFFLRKLNPWIEPSINDVGKDIDNH
ncbi:MAG: hypothetical protein H6Q25_330 [Bacteroidetes bacterium]|nr:hypothetical protein [Bacteroidota bacterium]